MILLYILSCASADPEVYTFDIRKPTSWDSGQSDGNINESSSSASSCEIPYESELASPLELDGRTNCGLEVYFNRCADCHGVNGEGTAQGQMLIDYIDTQSDESLLFSIQFGEGDMPPQNLLPQDAADVLAYIRAEFGS